MYVTTIKKALFLIMFFIKHAKSQREQKKTQNNIRRIFFTLFDSIFTLIYSVKNYLKLFNSIFVK